MTESVKVVIGQWYYELRHIQEILCEPITQLFIETYDSFKLFCDWEISCLSTDELFTVDAHKNAVAEWTIL